MIMVALALVIVISIAILFRPSSQQLPIEISDFSIKPSSVKEGNKATITVNVKNVDLKTHQIKFLFNVSPRVSMYAGAEQLLPKDNSFYVYNFTLEAADPTEKRLFTVTATLEEGTSRVDYPLSLTVSFDGEELKKTWDDLTLTVEK